MVKIRALRHGEEPVLPVGFQNLVTGKNRDFNVFEVWGTEKIESVSLIELQDDRTGQWNLRLNLSGRASQSARMMHDQTHGYIGDYRLIREYTGTYPQIFKQIIQDTGKKSIPAYVYK